RDRAERHLLRTRRPFATRTNVARPPPGSSFGRDAEMSDIAFCDVTRVFPRDGTDFLTLDHVSFDVRDREFVALVGPSGCGKTTCLRMAAGLEFPTSGTVTVGGAPVTHPGPDRAVVFQQFALFPWKSVYENIDFGLRSKGMPESMRR